MLYESYTLQDNNIYGLQGYDDQCTQANNHCVDQHSHVETNGKHIDAAEMKVHVDADLETAKMAGELAVDVARGVGEVGLAVGELAEEVVVGTVKSVGKVARGVGKMALSVAELPLCVIGDIFDEIFGS